MALPVTVADFRAAFPAFANADTFPDPAIQFWIDLGTIMCGNTYRWGDLLSYGIQLFVAHNLSLESASLGAGGGGIPGAVVGPLTGGHVDKVGYNRDPGAAMDPANGHWNLTTYGLRYIRLIRIIGAGPVQVGVPPGGSNFAYGGAWPGVVFPPANQ